MIQFEAKKKSFAELAETEFKREHILERTDFQVFFLIFYAIIIVWAPCGGVGAQGVVPSIWTSSPAASLPA